MNAFSKHALSDYLNSGVGNFYWYGHGSEFSFGSGLTDADIESGLSNISTTDLENVLGNKWSRRHKYLIRNHPFRLVIMEACSTAVDSQLAEAFGIQDGVHNKAWFVKHGLPSQAYVGWTIDILVPGCASYDDQFQSHSDHLADMFGLWMSEAPLVQCVAAGATPYLNGFGVPVPFDTPLDPNWRIFGDPYLTRAPANEP
jgi:hypothetical protein